MAPITVAGIILGSVAVVTLSTGRPVGHARPLRRPPRRVSRSKPAVKAHVVTVTGKDFKFDAPDEIPAGLTEFRFLNKGPSIHHMQILKLTNGKTFADLRTALGAPGSAPSVDEGSRGSERPRAGD